jgi:hypothetical protein
MVPKVHINKVVDEHIAVIGVVFVVDVAVVVIRSRWIAGIIDVDALIRRWFIINDRSIRGGFSGDNATGGENPHRNGNAEAQQKFSHARQFVRCAAGCKFLNSGILRGVT